MEAADECGVADDAPPLSSDDKGGFHCAACNKSYRNAAQLANHERSGKHKQMVGKLKRQLEEEGGHLPEFEELAIEDEGGAEERAAADADDEGGVVGGKAKGKKKKGRKDGALNEGDAGDGAAADEGADDVLEQAAASTALPSPGLVALQTRQAFESTDEFKKLNKTQRRKALLQWEAENAHIMEALRAEGKDEPRPEQTREPKEKKPEGSAKKEKVHGSGAHSREIKTPKKKKAVYLGGGNKIVEVE